MIGLTGGIASGKSTVAQILVSLGAIVLDADQIAREVVEPGEPGWLAVKAAFPEVVGPNEQIDRKKLGRIVFADKVKRTKLEEIIHPLVIDRIKSRGSDLEASGASVVADIPLLFETGCDKWLQPVWVVFVDPETQLARLMARDNLDRASARQRIESQMPLEEKRKRADRVINNSGTVQETRCQVEKLWREYNRAKNSPNRS